MAEKHEDKATGAPLYELGYHLVPTLGEEDLALRVADLQKKITELGGSIHSEGSPQSCTLAYTMRKLRGGKWEKYDQTFFGWTRFHLPPEGMSALKEDLEHNEFLVRYLLLALPKDALLPPKVRKPRPIELEEVETEPKALEKKQDEEKTALELWKDALSNVMPHVEVRSRRVGGATFQIPMQIRPDRKISTAMKWLISYSRKRNEKSMAQKLAAEILAASKEEGAAVKKRVDTHKMAEANKAFSHFRF